MDVTNVNKKSMGIFDYIIVHGVYSWVPEEVRKHILRVCSKCLSKKGVAYVSYNVFPGWHMRGMIRDVMCYHTGQFSDPKVQVGQARNLLSFLAKHSDEKGAYGKLLRSEVDTLSKHSDSYLYHDHLEEHNTPLYFHDFVQRAEDADLRYLGEADLSSMYAGHLPQEVASTLEKISTDMIQMEQYMDFVRNRMFRQTLLVHENTKIDREIKLSTLDELYVASPLLPTVKRPDIAGRTSVEFRAPNSERCLNSNTPLVKSAFMCLVEHSSSFVSYTDLVDMAYQRLSGPQVRETAAIEEEKKELAKILIKCSLSNMVEFRTKQGLFTQEVGETPEASVVARMQCENGASDITNLRHAIRGLDPVPRKLLPHLNGDNNKEALVKVLKGAIGSGELSVTVKSGSVEGSISDADLQNTVDQVLGLFARSALLLA